MLTADGIPGLTAASQQGLVGPSTVDQPGRVLHLCLAASRFDVGSKLSQATRGGFAVLQYLHLVCILHDLPGSLGTG